MSSQYESYRGHREEAARYLAKLDYAGALKSIDAAISCAPDEELLHIASNVRQQIAPKVHRFYWLQQLGFGRSKSSSGAA